MPQNFRVEKNASYPSFMINVKPGSSPRSPVLRNLSVSNADRRTQYGVSVMASSQRNHLNRTQIFNKESSSPNPSRKEDGENSAHSQRKSIHALGANGVNSEQDLQFRERSQSRSSKDSRFSRPISRVSKISKT